MAPKAPPIDGAAWISPEPGHPFLDPVPLGALAQSVTIVVFWSAGCEASLHRLRQLEELLIAGRPSDRSEPPLGDRLAGAAVDVVAVHTPRFPHDEHLDTVRTAMDRHRIPFTVVHDPDYVTWNRYNPHGWPSTAVIDGRSRLTGIQAGTGDVAVVADAVLLALAGQGDRHEIGASESAAGAGRRREDIQRRRLPVLDHRSHRADHDLGSISVERRRRLHHPEGVVALPDGRIVVADTGNDRLLVGQLTSDLTNCVLDHPIELFEEPTGLVHAGDDRIVVVERAGHRLWLMDLATGQRDLVTDQLERPTGCSLDRDGSLVVADPAANQLFRITRAFTVGAIAGSGICGNTPGPAAEAELAQPVAAARSAAGLVFLDAATSNIRLLTDDGEIVDITDNDFFQWGLIDGAAHRARFQRPSDLCRLADDSILITDTGNDRLRLLHGRQVQTLGLTGLNQPTAICRLGSHHALVADTGNHRVVALDPRRRRAWPVSFEGMDRMLSRAHRRMLADVGLQPGIEPYAAATTRPEMASASWIG
jgi:hypothetical protein